MGKKLPFVRVNALFFASARGTFYNINVYMYVLFYACMQYVRNIVYKYVRNYVLMISIFSFNQLSFPFLPAAATPGRGHEFGPRFFFFGAAFAGDAAIKKVHVQLSQYSCKVCP